MSAEPETQPNTMLQGIKSKVGNVSIFQEGGKVGVEREIHNAATTDDDKTGSPVAASIGNTRSQLQGKSHDTDFDLYDAMMDIDPELSGAVNAIAQSASSYEVVSPSDEPTEKGQKALEECQALDERLKGPKIAVDILRNLVKYGNDINKKVYDDEMGVKKVQSLPINAMTIVDDAEDLKDSTSDDPSGIFESLTQANSEEEEISGQEIDEVFSREAYVLNEDNNDADPNVIKPHNVLHFSIDARSNWHTDRVGRETYGIWGKSRLESLKFTIQTKYNTLTNKVAMDDKLLAREIYYMDTTELFGDINDFDERKKQAKKYAHEIKGMIEELGADERPILPDQVEVEVIGPDGKAIDQQPFLEQLNNSIAAALTFPMAGLGRGTTSVKAGEEISSLWAENNIKNLRGVVIQGFEEIFRDHIKLTHPEWVENSDSAENLGQMKLDPDVEIPTLEYEPFKEADMTEKARQLKLLYETETAGRAERREHFGFSTDDEAMAEVEDEFGAKANVPGAAPEPEGSGSESESQSGDGDSSSDSGEDDGESSNGGDE